MMSGAVKRLGVIIPTLTLRLFELCRVDYHIGENIWKYISCTLYFVLLSVCY